VTYQKGRKIPDDGAQQKNSTPEILLMDLKQSESERERRRIIMLTEPFSHRRSFPLPWERLAKKGENNIGIIYTANNHEQ
jgi:hypothetical protein